MKPFSSYLYSACSGFNNLDVRVPVSEDLVVVVELWVMMLVLTVIQPTRFQRSISSFAVVEPSLLPNFDASLVGFGIIVYRIISRIDSFGHRHVVGHQVVIVACYATPYQLQSESKFQNAMEFLTVVACVGLLVSLGYRRVALSLLGDSRTALHWSHRERFPSAFGKPASVQYMQLMSHPGVELVISDTEYLNTLLNVHCDLMSRGKATPSSLGYGSAVIYDLGRNLSLSQWIDLMDPAAPFKLSGLQSHWAKSDTLLQVLLSNTGGWVTT